MQTHAEYVAAQIAARPVEAKIVRKIVRALKAAGNPITSVEDSDGETTPVTTEADVLAIAFNLDDLWLVTQSGSWVRLIMGEGYDLINDYGVSLEDALTPVNEWIEAHDI